MREIVLSGHYIITARGSDLWLPLEMWLHILELAEGNSDKDTYQLVQPCSSEKGLLGRIFTFKKAINTEGCSFLIVGEGAKIYEEYLDNPVGDNKNRERGWNFDVQRNRYFLDEADDRRRDERSRSIPLPYVPETTEITTIPARYLDGPTPILFCKVVVPDIIHLLNNHICHFCNGGEWDWVRQIGKVVPCWLCDYPFGKDNPVKIPQLAEYWNASTLSSDWREWEKDWDI